MNKHFTNSIMENKYPEGAIVYAKVNPSIRLAVRRYVKRIYYCTNLSHPSEKELVYFERELMDTNLPTGS